MKVTGEIMIFKNDKGYSTTISNKKEDGTFDNMSIVVNFRKGVEIANKTRILVVDGFLSFYINKEDKKIPKIVVLAYEPMKVESTIEEDDELPF